MFKRFILFYFSFEIQRKSKVFDSIVCMTTADCRSSPKHLNNRHFHGIWILVNKNLNVNEKWKFNSQITNRIDVFADLYSNVTNRPFLFPHSKSLNYYLTVKMIYFITKPTSFFS